MKLTMRHFLARAWALFKKPSLTGFYAALVMLGAANSPVQAGLLDHARKCTSETRRLERLACFDQVFGTPLAEPVAGAVPGTQVNLRPASSRWRQAYAQADASTGGVQYRDTGQAAGLLVTVPALGAQPPRPLLALQCHNNITELTLMLPEPLEAERVNIGLGTSENTGQNAWRVRDNGYVLSIGRGLPAIRAVKAIERETDIRVFSQNSPIDGLLFDLTGFGDAIRPLRKRCGW